MTEGCFLAFGFLCVSLGVAAAQHNSQNAPVIYIAPEIKLGGARTVESALREPFPSIYEVTVVKAQDGKKKVLTNCLDYLSLNGERFTTGSSLDDKSVRSLGATCDALDLIRGAKGATHPLFANFSWARVKVSELPPEFALAISRQDEAKARDISAKGGSILQMEPGVRLRPRSPNRAVLVAQDWTATLTVDAHADFLGDGNEELLVRWVSQATGGTYTATYVFLLGRRENMLTVIKRRPELDSK